MMVYEVRVSALRGLWPKRRGAWEKAGYDALLNLADAVLTGQVEDTTLTIKRATNLTAELSAGWATVHFGDMRQDLPCGDAESMLKLVGEYLDGATREVLENLDIDGAEAFLDEIRSLVYRASGQVGRGIAALYSQAIRADDPMNRDERFAALWLQAVPAMTAAELNAIFRTFKPYPARLDAEMNRLKVSVQIYDTQLADTKQIETVRQMFAQMYGLHRALFPFSTADEHQVADKATLEAVADWLSEAEALLFTPDEET